MHRLQKQLESSRNVIDQLIMSRARDEDETVLPFCVHICHMGTGDHACFSHRVAVRSQTRINPRCRFLCIYDAFLCFQCRLFLLGGSGGVVGERRDGGGKVDKLGHRNGEAIADPVGKVIKKGRGE